jgi:GC-rich sequence DNA-binding factor
MINKRRMEDNEDDLVLLYGVPADMQDAEQQIDELGRVIPSSTAPQSAVRRERRQERARRYLGSSGKDMQASEQGYATDSELYPSDAADFEEAVNVLKKKVQAEIFQDVKAKAFRDPKHGIAVWFKDWKDKYPDIYQSAFGGMGLVQAWEFWARVELIGWIPLDVSFSCHVPIFATHTWPADISATRRVQVVYATLRLCPFSGDGTGRGGD